MKAKYMEIKGIPGFYGRIYAKEDNIVMVLKNLSKQYPGVTFLVKEEK